MQNLHFSRVLARPSEKVLKIFSSSSLTISQLPHPYTTTINTAISAIATAMTPIPGMIIRTGDIKGAND
jgi:hypothetical protein